MVLHAVSQCVLTSERSISRFDSHQEVGFLRLHGQWNVSVRAFVEVAIDQDHASKYIVIVLEQLVFKAGSSVMTKRTTQMYESTDSDTFHKMSGPFS